MRPVGPTRIVTIQKARLEVKLTGCWKGVDKQYMNNYVFVRS